MISRSPGLVTAINPNKFVTAINVATSRQTIVIDKPCQGLLVQMRALEKVEILIDYVDRNSNRRAVVRQMPLTAYLSFAQRYMQLSKVHKVASDKEITHEPSQPAYADEFVFILPFSIDGSLPLNDDNKYEVTFVNTDSTQGIELYYDLYETPVQGYPISINKQVIRQVDMEKHIDLSAVDTIVLNKFDSILFDTPFGQSDQTIEMLQHLTNVVDSIDGTEYANNHICLNSSQFPKVTLRHSEDEDFNIYLVDYIAPTKAITSTGQVAVTPANPSKNLMSTGSVMASADFVSAKF